MPESESENRWPDVWHFRNKDDGSSAGFTEDRLIARSNVFYDIETYIPLHSIRERLLQRAYAAGGGRAREHRLGIRHDEEGFEHRDAHEELPDALCSADMMAAYGIVRAALDAAFPLPDQEER